MNIGRKAIVAVGILCILTVVFALTVSDQWWMRVFDYPRLQITVVTGVVLVISILLLSWDKRWVKAYIAILTAALGYQGYILVAYTSLVAPQAPDREIDDTTRSFSLLSANVRMDNRDAHSFLELVAQ